MQLDIPERAAPPRRYGRSALGMALGVLTSMNIACYSYLPVSDTSPQPGARVRLQLNDEGRVAMHDQVGTGADRIEGTVVDAREGQYVLRVSAIRGIRGETSHWTGEQVRIPLSAVARVDGRRFSRQRTMVAVGAAVGALAVLVLAGSLAGFGWSSDTPPEGPPGGSNNQ